MLRNFWLGNYPEETSMVLEVPEAVAEYLAAEEAKDADALSRCFTEDGTVHDEGQDYHGRDSIRQWKQSADAKYRYVFQAINVQTFGDLVTVRARLTGGFPGSPVELDHIFKLSGDKIASMEIRS
jgi:ketosteroid isomerase-like protein